MWSDLTSLTRKVARGLRYRTLRELIGRRVLVNSLESLETDIHQTLAATVVSDCELVKPERKYLERAIAKYGILDLTFHAPQSLIETDYETGIALLKALHFVTHKANSEKTDEIVKQFEDLGLSALEENLAEQKSLVRLYMQAEAFVRNSDNLLAIPPSFFPRDFMIEDACATNGDSVWLNRHFYF